MRRNILYLVPIAAILFASCKKFLDINTDPNNPTEIEVSKILPLAQRTLGDALAIGEDNGGLSQVLAVYTHQMTTREESDQYGATGNEFYLQLGWSKLFGTSPPPGASSPVFGVLNNLEDIIRIASADGNFRYVGIAKVLKAYTFSQLVDVFGDVPYSEANKLKEGIVYPKFDDDAVIYDSIFALINSGIADLTNTTTNTVNPGSDDLIYGGNVTSWVKAANTLKLKLYTQIRKVRDVSAEINTLITAGNLINQTSESFLIPYGPIGATDDRHPGFATYYATQRSNHVSPWFFEILKGYNTRINTGNPDPRIPYYIYNQINAIQASREGNATEYRDSAFASIYFGSVGPDRDRSQQNTLSVFGIYPVGGKYDDKSATTATGTSGTGAAPQRLITYADRLYLEAELMQAGVVAGDAKAKTKQAIEESFKQVDYVITQHVKPAQTVPALVGSVAVTNYINNVMAEYDAGDANKKLEIIMTQKWISNIGNAVDQYTDIRRTGYPVIFNPLDPTMAPGGFVQPPINGNPLLPGAQAPVRVQLSKSFPLTLPWAQGELETNQNAPSQKADLSTHKPFWMP
jgi:hypothetical protein